MCHGHPTPSIGTTSCSKAVIQLRSNLRRTLSDSRDPKVSSESHLGFSNRPVKHSRLLWTRACCASLTRHVRGAPWFTSTCQKSCLRGWLNITFHLVPGGGRHP